MDIDGEKVMFDCGPAATHKLCELERYWRIQIYLKKFILDSKCVSKKYFLIF